MQKQTIQTMILTLPYVNKIAKQASTLGVLLICNLLILIPYSQANSLNKLSSDELSSRHQCDKSFNYSVYLFSDKVGFLHRTINWHTKTEAVKATVTSYGEVSFLWLDSTYQQTSTMKYSSTDKHFLTTRFSQKMTGVKSREMTAIMSDNGLSSTVTLDDEVFQYQQAKTNKDESLNKNNPLYDLDTLGTQIRLNLLRGKTRFTLSRQASKKIETYEFEVVGNDIINHKKWGQLQSTKVVEVGKHSKMVLWFSAKHDHQLIKAQLDMMFSPVVWLSEFSMQCESSVG